jgi:hypothetical protein
MEEFLFNLHVINGYAFKNLLTIIKCETKTATMLLSANNIEISFINNNSGGLHIINMNPHENIEWLYNPTDEDGNLLELYPIGFNAIDVYNTIKNIGMNDSIRLFLIKGENTIMVQPLKSASKDMGQFKIFKFDIIETEYTRYDVGNYKETPNIKIYSKSFSDLCSEVGNVKCEYIDIEGDGEAVTFRGFNGSKKEVYINRYDDLSTSKNNHKPKMIADNISDIDNLIAKMNVSDTSKSKTGLKLKIINDDKIVVKVPISTFKSLSKIDNISPKGSVLRFYLEKNQPIKIETAIGTFGNYQIYLK